MMSCVEHARSHVVDGYQVAVIEYARNILGWADANSTEFDEATEHPVVLFMPEISKTHMGGTMRLGQRATYFTDKNCVTSVSHHLISWVLRWRFVLGFKRFLGNFFFVPSCQALVGLRVFRMTHVEDTRPNTHP